MCCNGTFSSWMKLSADLNQNPTCNLCPTQGKHVYCYQLGIKLLMIYFAKSPYHATVYASTTTVSELTTGYGPSEVSNQKPAESELTTGHGSNEVPSKKPVTEKQGGSISGCPQHYMMPGIAVSSALVILAHHIS